MSPGQRNALRAHVLRTGICGETRTTRDSCVAHARLLADGDPDKLLGLGARGRDAASIMRAVADLCGCSPDLDDVSGGGVIDPDRTLEALSAMGRRLALAASRGERVLVATGHPTGLLPMYQAVARALGAAGVSLSMPFGSRDEPLTPPAGVAVKRARSVLYLDGVACLSVAAGLMHTHESWPMDRLLDADPRVDLVLADHGWAGAAIARGIETVCFTDVNDPAIAVAAADDLVEVVVPCDDNLPPSTYDPVRDYLVARIAEGVRTG